MSPGVPLEELYDLVAGAVARPAGEKSKLLAMYYAPLDCLAKEYGVLLALWDEKPPHRENYINEIGNALESVCAAVFCGLGRGGSGRVELSSSSGMGGQFDLVVSHDCPSFRSSLRKCLYDSGGMDIIVEAKAWKSRPGDKEFSRLCGHVTNASSTCAMGVFVSPEGVAGIRGGVVKDNGIAATRQYVLHKTTSRPVVVLDRLDLNRLVDGENLVSILMEKIRAIDTGALSVVFVEKGDAGEWVANAPPHIRRIANAAGAALKEPPRSPGS